MEATTPDRGGKGALQTAELYATVVQSCRLSNFRRIDVQIWMSKKSLMRAETETNPGAER